MYATNSSQTFQAVGSSCAADLWPYPLHSGLSDVGCTSAKLRLELALTCFVLGFASNPFPVSLLLLCVCLQIWFELVLVKSVLQIDLSTRVKDLVVAFCNGI